MAISSATITRSSVLSGLNNSTYCSVCGKATSVTAGVYASYGGRIGSDSYVCETCGKTLTSQKNSASQSNGSFYTASGVTSSGYCPRCNTTSGTTSWAGTVASTGSTSSSATAKSSGTTYGGPSWTK
ncbi:MAG: hypothetical protein LBQ50_12290 [Planctomycetaceae bacterium]|jgi:RNA polymerase subunit RPABC4/transcription elongation factor Spt4|nr:hypothetical protein [Planctomycetaceae bacterium]